MKRKWMWVNVVVMFFSAVFFNMEEVSAFAKNIGTVSSYHIKTYTGGTVELSGTVIKSEFEDVQSGGDIVTNECTLLRLDQPINISLYNGKIIKNNYPAIQICYVGRKPHDAVAWIDKHVIVRGKLNESPSGHYYDSVILDIDDIQLSAKPADPVVKEQPPERVRPKKTRLKKVMRKNKNKAVVKWKKIKGISEYMIQYSTQKNFKKAHIKTIKNRKVSSVTLKGIKKNRKYYFRVCTYIKQSGKKYRSGWSNMVVVKKYR